MNIKTVLYAFLLGSLMIFSFGFTETNKEVTLTCKVAGCEKVDSLFLFEFSGVVFSKIGSTPRLEDGTYQFKLPKTEQPRFYYVGNNMQSLKPLILGTEEEVLLTGSCLNFRGAIIQNSKINQDYQLIKQKINTQKSKVKSLTNQYRQAGRDSAKIAQIDGDIKKLDEERLMWLEGLKERDPYMRHVVAFNTYLSFRNYGQGYPNEIQYFANTFFQFVDWTNEDYEYLPWVFEGTKSYATTLSSIQLPKDQHQMVLENLLKNIPEDTRTYQLAFGGILAGMQAKNHPNYIYFGQKFVQKYKATDMRACVEVNRQIRNIKGTILGGEAPNFTMKTPEGEDMSLTDLRGKYVLIDFWASWCGPCRRENPNVVAMYNKYKERDFEILSVSLDGNKDRWIQAIEKDGMDWHHVSDLKKWQNAAAKMYGVRSIPHTVLLDKEGKILARNLRGPNLEAKLKEIMGD
ncbi:MAG: TlpA family protein disulfide reductase [Bacteroidetes bacterium]|jgi:peroxiredoxin|nr:TlpA family protein disulfide reductase [Bacteroidota bacterium]MDF1868369.1 TlpA disulfide reductase family protein [Saprospiraceae bacterium]